MNLWLVCSCCCALAFLLLLSIAIVKISEQTADTTHTHSMRGRRRGGHEGVCGHRMDVMTTHSTCMNGRCFPARYF